MVFKLPSEFSLNFTDEKNGADNWKKVKERELEWLQKLRALVAQDTVQTVLDSLSKILHGAVRSTILTRSKCLHTLVVFLV